MRALFAHLGFDINYTSARLNAISVRIAAYITENLRILSKKSNARYE